MKKQTVITGGAGFIGIHLTKKLIESNYHVIIIDDLSNANVEILEKLPNGSYTLVKSDINETGKIINSLDNYNPTCLIHLVALHYIPYCIKHPNHTKKININGTQSALKIAKEKNIQKFIFSSSAAVYSPSNHHHKETDSLSPVEIYGDTKIKAEKIIQNYCEKKNLNYTILRLFNVYGKYDLTPHFIPAIISRSKNSNTIKTGNLNTKRDYIYIKDLVDLLMEVIKDTKNKNMICNAGTGVCYSGEEIIKIISEIKKTKIKITQNKKLTRKNDRKNLAADINNVSRAYGWQPRCNIRKGLENLIKNQ